MILTIDASAIDKTAAKRIDGRQRITWREMDVPGGKPVPKEAGILPVRLAQRQTPGLAQ